MSANKTILMAAAVSMTTVAFIVYLTQYIDLSALYYVAALSLGGAATFISLRNADHIPRRIFWSVTILLHVAAIFGAALYEDDYFRFIWDGWQTLQGTPYGKPPAQFYTDSDVPEYLWPILDNVNNPQVPTIYGPILQFIFALNFSIFGTNPMGLRIIFALANIILIVVLARRNQLHKVALYAWSPLVVSEIIIHIHPDAVMAALLSTGLYVMRKHPILAGALWGGAAATKIIALAAWPLMLRYSKKTVAAAIISLALLYGYFAALGPSIGFDSTSTFASEWLFNPMGILPFLYLFPHDIARISAALVGIALIMLIHARTRDKEHPPLASIFGIILLLAPAVNSWYMIWILPFAINSRQIWPFVAASVIPLSYVTGLTLDTETLQEYEVHTIAWSIEIIAITIALIYDFIKAGQIDSENISTTTPIHNPKVGVIIPALNEAQSIGPVVKSIAQLECHNVEDLCIFIVDNGSTDETAQIAAAAGANIVTETQRGYGAACLAGIAALPDDVNIILFMDADGSDVPKEAIGLIEPIIAGDADMVIGSRSMGRIEAGAMTPPQRFGNWLATRLVRIIWQKKITDLGPFRAIRHDALNRLAMADRDFGWTIEMQVKAIQQNMRVLERPADYRKRIGVSKISGTVKGVLGAGTKILYVIGREAYSR